MTRPHSQVTEILPSVGKPRPAPSNASTVAA